MVLGTNSINGQCDNGTNYYPATPFTPPPLAWSSAALDNWAGEVIPINVRTGYEYQFSTCGNYGGVTATYDTQLSLYDDNRNVVAFNDDFSKVAGLGLKYLNFFLSSVAAFLKAWSTVLFPFLSIALLVLNIS